MDSMQRFIKDRYSRISEEGRSMQVMKTIVTGALFVLIFDLRKLCTPKMPCFASCVIDVVVC